MAFLGIKMPKKNFAEDIKRRGGWGNLLSPSRRLE